MLANKDAHHPFGKCGRIQHTIRSSGCNQPAHCSFVPLIRRNLGGGAYMADRIVLISLSRRERNHFPRPCTLLEGAYGGTSLTKKRHILGPVGLCLEPYDGPLEGG